LDPVTYEAVTEVSIDKDVLIPDDAEIKVSTDGLLGGSYLEVTAGGSPFMLEADGEFTYTQGSVSLINLLLKFGGGDDE
jgi:phospholipid/cholesterol/gamma-HCH transport system substrate-binding protein